MFKAETYFEMKIVIYRNYNCDENLLLEKTDYEMKT